MKRSSIRQKYQEFFLSSLRELEKGKKIFFVIINILLSIYITFVVYTSNSAIFINPALTFQVICKSIFLSIIIFHLILFLCVKSKLLHITIHDRPHQFNKKTWMLYSVLCFLVLLIPYAIHFPGFTSYDTFVQWNQVQQFQFDNWHPVIHTWTIWLITRIYNHYAFVIFFQILLFSFAVGYLIATLETWIYTKKLLLPIGLFIVLNPFTQGLVLYMWKDIVFTTLLVFIAAYLINIYLSDGSWLIQWKNIIIFSFCIGLATLVRHNGMFFTVPLLTMLLFFYLKGNWRVSLIVVFTGLLIVLIRGPLYSVLKVSYPDNVYLESVGIPMTIMGDVLVKNPQALSTETKDFLNTIATDDEWKKRYIQGDFNSIKGPFHVWDYLPEVPVKDFIKMTIQTIQSDPLNSFLAIRKITASVWGVFGDFHTIEYFSSRESLLNESNSIRKLLKNCLFIFDNLIVSIPLIGGLLTKTGLQMLLLLLTGIISFYSKGAKIFLLVIPSVVYNLGTMLLLCTDSDIRFFHFNVVITLPFILVLLSKSRILS